MKTNKNYLYIIKNVKSPELILVYNVLNNNFILLDKNKIIINDNYISNFELHYIREQDYNLVYTYNIKLLFNTL